MVFMNVTSSGHHRGLLHTQVPVLPAQGHGRDLHLSALIPPTPPTAALFQAAAPGKKHKSIHTRRNAPNTLEGHFVCPYFILLILWMGRDAANFFAFIIDEMYFL